jgi:hypothetical protein
VEEKSRLQPGFSAQGYQVQVNRPSDPLSTIIEKIRPENKLLLSSVQKGTTLEKAEQMKEAIQRGIDWNSLVQSAERHGLIPFVYRSLKDACPEEVPEEILFQLKELFRANTLRNLSLTGTLLKLMHLLEISGIRAIPYKGPTLALSAYGDLSYRQFDDLDILIEKEDVVHAKEILLTQRYKPELDLDGLKEVYYLRSGCEYNFDSIDDGSHVEMHWDFLPGYYLFRFDPERFWDRLEPVSISGKEVLTFSPQDLLMILCTQYGWKHRWERLGWISDIGNLISSHKEVDWESLLEKGKQAGIGRTVCLGFFLASSLVGVDLPRRILRELEADTAVQRLAFKVYERLFLNGFDQTGIFDDHLFYLRMREKVGDRLQYILRRLLTPNIDDWTLFKLPAYLYPFYYFIRPIRLAARYAMGITKRVFPSTSTPNT